MHDFAIFVSRLEIESRMKKIIQVLSVSAFLSGCAADRGALNSVPDVQIKTKTFNTVVGGDFKKSLPEKEEPVVFKGNDRVIKLPSVRPPIKLYGEAVALNFEQAPLVDVVHAVLGDMLGLDYIIEHPIAGEVTLRTRTPVPKDQLLEILESLLRSNSAVMVRDKEDRIFVSSSMAITERLPQVSNSKDLGAGFSTTIIPLQYIGAGDMADILRPMANKEAFVRIDSTRNLLMLAGTRSQMEGWLEIISTFDVDMLKGMSVGIFPLEHATVEDVKAALAGLTGNNESSANAEAVGGVIGGAVKIIPVERLNSILVITPKAHYLEKIEEWIDRLDRSPSDNLERRLYVYPVQNTSSEHLARLLSAVYSGSGPSEAASGSSGLAPGLVEEKITGEGKTQGNEKQSSDKKASSVRNVQLGSSTSIVADEDNNALLVYATGSEYKKIEAALSKLDVVPAQVLIEASIIEVSLSDDLQYGVQWAFSNGAGGGDSLQGQLTTSESGIVKLVPGFSYALANSAGSIEAVLNALAEKSLLNVISTPSVMVLDNNTASIQVGDQQPVRTGQSVNSDGNVLSSSIEYKDTGVKLSVTPSVNAGGLVTMDVSQTVTDVGKVDSATGQRAFNTRDIQSRVAIRSGESVVLGGLIRENKLEGDVGAPILKDLPVVGALFGKKTETGSRTELLVIITPKVMFNDFEVRQVTSELRSKMSPLTLIGIQEMGEK